MKSRIVLGIDPGIDRMGYSFMSHFIKDDSFSPLLKMRGESYFSPISFGLISTKSNRTTEERQLEIKKDFEDLLNKYSPDICMIESLYFHSKMNPSFVRVCESKGVVKSLLLERGIPIVEVNPLTLKKCITGYGRAPKERVQECVRKILSLSKKITPDDTADAVALSLLDDSFLLSYQKYKKKATSELFKKSKLFNYYLNKGKEWY